ncbi:MAG: class F sortase [Ilumatobacter sp.]|nr:class F sortase [Ilumatobacter sp.]
MKRMWIGLFALVLVAGACSSTPSRGATEALIAATIDGVVPGLPAGTTPPSVVTVRPPSGTQSSADADVVHQVADDSTRLAGSVVTRPAAAPSPLAELVQPIGSATYDPNDHVTAARPLTISIADLGVERAPIDPVGVKNEGELDVPDPLVVGWYTGSSVPGRRGASVLAAHVNYNGVPGVFRYLRDLDGGELVEIGYEDGTTQTFEIVAVELYDKDELPEALVWAKDGDPTLVLFTCGGRFNRAQRSYEDNVVAFARPVETDPHPLR